jgi:restriction system protein
MTRQSRRGGRAGRRKQNASVQVLGAGLALTIFPLVMGSTPVGKALGALMPVGLFLLAVGALLMWLNRDRRPPADAVDEPSLPRGPRTRDARRAVPRQEHLMDRPPLEPAWAAQQPERGMPTAPTIPTEWGVAVFDMIEWRRFEAVVEALFQQAGFATKSQSHGADGGVDVWLYSRHEPGVPVSLVQCKHQVKRVGVDKIRELRGVMASHDVKRGQFATTSAFTPDAEAFARENGINLLDVTGLLKLIAQRTQEQQRALLAVALEGDYMRPTCVNCGVKMIDRTPRDGGKAFWGCANFPRCKTRLPMRAA